jgi:hypothetical protein
MLFDAATGAAGSALLGGAAPVVGAGVRRALAPVARKGAALVAKGTQRAQQQAAEESAKAVAKLEGAAGERAANAYRQMERIELALQNPALPQTERAALEAFKRTPEYAELVAANAKGILSAAPGAAAEREAASIIAQQARQDLPQAIQSRAAELMVPQPKADTLSYLKSYAEPVLMSAGLGYLGDQVGGEWGGRLGAAGGFIFGRTRGGKALMSRLTRPAHQIAIGNALRRIGLGSPPTVPPRATRATAAALGPEIEDLLTGLYGRPGLAGAAADEE